MEEETSLKFRLNILYLVTILFVFILLLLASSIWEEGLAKMSQIQAGMIPILILLGLVSRLLYPCISWYILLSLGYKRTLRTVYLIVTTSLGASLATPVKIGIPLRIFLYQTILKVPYSIGAASLVLEVFIGSFLGVIISICGIFILFSSLDFLMPLLGALLLLLILLLMLFTKPRNYDALLSIWPLKKIKNRLIAFIIKTQNAIKGLNKSQLLVLGILFISSYILSTLRLYFVLFSFSIQLNLLTLLYIQSISFIAGSLSMLPMGIGVRDLSKITLLNFIGVPTEISILVAIIERLLTSGISFALGVISASVLSLKKLRR